MHVDLPFGKRKLPLDLPDGYDYRLLEARSAVPVTDAMAAIEAALDSPIGRPPLQQFAAGKRSVAISVCDITRPAPNRMTLPPILERLHRAGIEQDEVTILIATGLHRPATKDEIREIVGAAVAEQYRAVNHHAREKDEHRFLGHTASGTPVYIDERFMAADLRITLGLIEPHLMLGFSGGRKLVAPGLAGEDTIKTLHSPRFMRLAKAVEGSVEDNPLHHELLEIARMGRHDFLLDVVLSNDRRLAGVYAGEPVEAHRQGVAHVARTLVEELDEPVDAVITTGAGYPLDLTFYQSIKGVTAAQHIIRPGGRILLVAECQEGCGAPEFREMVRSLTSYEDFLHRILDTPVVVDQWQLEKLALVGSKLEVLFYVPGLPPEYQAPLGDRAFSSPDAAVKALTGGLKPGAKIAVIPEGPYVLAKLRETVGAR
jgi:nickel-dependent lactate racemase